MQPKLEAKTSSAKKKKKAKQKQKRASGSVIASNGPSATAKQTTLSAALQADEDIDKLLASLNITQAALSEASTSGRTADKSRPDEPNLLGVNPSKLKADDEMRRIFGSRVVDAEARNDQAGGFVGGSRRVRRSHRHLCLALTHTASLHFLPLGLSVRPPRSVTQLDPTCYRHLLPSPKRKPQLKDKIRGQILLGGTNTLYHWQRAHAVRPMRQRHHHMQPCIPACSKSGCPPLCTTCSSLWLTVLNVCAQHFVHLSWNSGLWQQDDGSRPAEEGTAEARPADGPQGALASL